MPQEELTSFTVSDACILLVFGSESRSRIEYLISTNNTIMLDSYINLTNKSNLIDRV